MWGIAIAINTARARGGAEREVVVGEDGLRDCHGFARKKVGEQGAGVGGNKNCDGGSRWTYGKKEGEW